VDNATHAFAGLLLADTTLRVIERRTQRPASRSLRRVAVALGVIAAEVPDADLLYSGPVVGMGKLGYLLHHRGHTHTVVFVVLAALVLWWIATAVRARSDDTVAERHGESGPLLALAVAGTLSHLLLDFTNSYGVHPFWPIDNRWVYGDAVFIVEPWLWVIAIPPLLFGPRRAATRVVLSLLLAAILAAAWLLGAMTTALAAAVTMTAVVWLIAQRVLTPSRRVAGALVAWGVIEGLFALSSRKADQIIRQSLAVEAPSEVIHDVALTPTAANANCFDVLVVSTDGATYRVRNGAARPWSRRGIRADSACVPGLGDRGSRFGLLRGVRALAASADTRVIWRDAWQAPRDALQAIAAERCGGAALRFMRVPVWEIEPDGSRRLTDARFGFGGGGFAEVRSPPGVCSLSPRAWIPAWVPPRADIVDIGH